MGLLENLGILKAGDWGSIPAALNMTVKADGTLAGLWGGVTAVSGIHESEQIEWEDANGQRQTGLHHYTNVSAPFSPPLLCGLDCVSRAWSERVKEKILGASDLRSGHAEFDRLYGLYAADSALALQLIRPVASLLSEVHPTVPNLTISDRSVTVKINGWTHDLSVCRAAFEAVARVATVMQTQRAATVASWEPALHYAWSAVATAWGLRFDPKLATMNGTVRSLDLHARTDYEQNRLQTSVEITLPSIVPASFCLARQDGDGVIARMFRGQDIVVGHPVFDAMFVVKGQPEAHVRALLTPKACGWLIAAYTQLSGVELANRSFRVAAPSAILDARGLQSFLDLCFSAAESLVPERQGSGPFR